MFCTTERYKKPTNSKAKNSKIIFFVFFYSIP